MLLTNVRCRNVRGRFGICGAPRRQEKRGLLPMHGASPNNLSDNLYRQGLLQVPAGAARDKVILILHPQVLHPDKVWLSIMYRGSSFLLPCFEHYQLFQGLNSVTRRVTKVTQTGLGFPVECAILQSARCWADYRKLGAMVHDRSLRPWLQNSALS